MNRGIFLILLVTAFVPGCDSSRQNDDSFEVTFEPEFVVSQMQTAVTNPYFPLPVGATWIYEGQVGEGIERVLVEVMTAPLEVAGIQARVVRDRVFLNGELIEDTVDWYAQDAAGNVWYLGEETAEYEDGEIVSTEGSWETGVDGARAGIIMPGNPAVGQAYYQEFYAGQAEDRGKVLSVNERVTVPTGTYDGCVKTEDTTPLEPDVLEFKYYCVGVGVVLEVDLEEDTQIPLLEVHFQEDL